MPRLDSPDGPLVLRRWLASTPRRTFVLYPALVVAFELVVRKGSLSFEPLGLVLLAWGFAQYRWSGAYRISHGGGGPGLDKPPQRLVTMGIYRFTRNPMYTGHLIFMAGLALTFRSWAALALLIYHLWWFNQRVIADELRMRALFGHEYEAYARRVRRWGVI